MPAATALLTNTPTNGARLVSTDGRTLPLSNVTLSAEAAGGLCRVTLEHRFVNPFNEALRVRYLVPLPEDAAVSAYHVVIGERTVTGKIATRSAAREQFELAIVEGRTAALLEEERGSLFSQELGNVPARATIVCMLTIDQRLVWLDEGSWEWRFPTTVAPRYLGDRTADAERIVVPIADAKVLAQLELGLRIGDEGALPHSPSHSLRMDSGRVVGSAALDRDVVVRWGARRPEVGVALVAARNEKGAHGLVTLTPPSLPGRTIERDVCILLDTSGSMGGTPLDQARRVAGGIIDSLTTEDRLEMIEFGASARRWHRGATSVDARAKAAAHEWLDKLVASGSTDMTAGILEALDGLRADAQRQVVLITDGQIGFEREVLQQVRAKLPGKSRLHTIGVGSAVNRSLTSPAARAGAGIEIVLGVDEDPLPAARRLVRRTAQPLVTEVTLSGSAVIGTAPARVADLYASSPALLSAALRPEGGALIVRGRTATGTYEARMFVPPIAEAATALERALAPLFARERVADLELDHATGENVDAQIEKLGLDHEIATRLTSFVAMSNEVMVDPNAPSRRQEMPHQLPYGMSAQGIGLRPGHAAPPPPPAQAPYESRILQMESAPKGGVASASSFGDGAASKPARPKMVASPAPFPSRQRSVVAKQKDRAIRVRGKVVLRRGRTLIVEITLDVDRDWQPSAVLVDGAAATMEPGTTRGAMTAGQIARLVLTVDGTPTELELVLGGELVTVELVA